VIFRKKYFFFSLTLCGQFSRIFSGANQEISRNSYILHLPRLGKAKSQGRPRIFFSLISCGRKIENGSRASAIFSSHYYRVDRNRKNGRRFLQFFNKKRPEGNSFLNYSPAGTVVLYVIVCLLYFRASFAVAANNLLEQVSPCMTITQKQSFSVCHKRAARASFAMLNINRNCSTATCWGLRFPKPSYGAEMRSLCRAKGDFYQSSRTASSSKILSSSTLFVMPRTRFLTAAFAISSL